MVSTATMNGQKTGQIVQVIGSTFDVEFDEGIFPRSITLFKIEEEFKGVKMKVTAKCSSTSAATASGPSRSGPRRALSRHESRR